MNDDSMSSDLALQQALRQLARDEPPRRTLWPRIARSLPPRRSSWPLAGALVPALAASVLVVCGLGLLLPMALAQASAVPGAATLREAMLQLEGAQARLAAAQRLQPHAAYLTELRVHYSLQRAALERLLQGS